MTGLQPACRNCRFVSMDDPEGPRCRKHRFIMPRIDWHIVCADYEGDQGLEQLPRLEAGQLYYYSGEGPALRCLALSPFADLKNPLASVVLREDREFGWVLYPRSSRDYFPAPSTFVTVLLDQRPGKFQVVSIERSLAMELVPMDAGRWEGQAHLRYVLMLRCMESPTLLREWLEKHIDLAAYMDDHSNQRFPANLFAFAEVIQPGARYALHPDWLVYEKYVLTR